VNAPAACTRSQRLADIMTAIKILNGSGMTDALIHAFIIDPAGAVRTVDFAGVAGWQSQQGKLWVHLDANFPESLTWLRKEAALPRLIPEALVTQETRPRSTMVEDGLLLVLRGVNLNPGADPEDMVSIRMWVEEHRVITTRRRRLLSVQDAVESLQDRPPSGTADLVLRIVEGLVGRINQAIDSLEDRVAGLEDGMLANPVQAMRAELAELRREGIALRRYLAPQREALGRLYSETPAWFQDLDRMRLREMYDRMVRLVEDLDAVRERATVIQEELVGRLSDQLNQRIYLLSITAALFLPLGFLTGLLGINVGGIPGAENPAAFWVFCGLLALLLTGQIAFFVRSKWF
jgi:zinc transporter